MNAQEHAFFEQAVLEGHANYRQIRLLKQEITPRYLYDFLMNTLLNTHHSMLANVGHVCGWFAAMQQDKEHASIPALVQDAVSGLQEVQARLHASEVQA